MHPIDILKYGNHTVLNTLDDFPKNELYTSGACGYWSVKDIIAHLGSFELVLVEVLNGFLDSGPTVYLDAYLSQEVNFNDDQIDMRRKDMSMVKVIDEHKDAHELVMDAAAKIPPGSWRRNGALPWYGEEYDLEDFIVYSYYAHKREHCGQIDVFTDRFK